MHWKIPRVTEEPPPLKQATAVICHAVHRNSLTQEKRKIETTLTPAELRNGSKDRRYLLKESHTNVPHCCPSLFWSVIKQVTSVLRSIKAFCLVYERFGVFQAHPAGYSSMPFLLPGTTGETKGVLFFHPHVEWCLHVESFRPFYMLPCEVLLS